MNDETRLARLLTQTGRIPEETLRVVLEEREQRAREGRPAPDLPTILVERGLMTAEAVREVMRIPPELAERIETARRDAAKKIGKFLLLDQLGQGGMGIVYRGWQTDLQRVVAVKLLGAPADAELRARFLREARLSSRLRHANIVQVHEYGEDGERAYFAMDFVEGVSFDALVKPPGQPLPQTLRMLAAIARALHYAHRQGIVHRDIKPQNILVSSDGTPFLSDFGLAREASSTSQLTLSGQIIGTPSFMSPEQAAGKHALVDARSDVYSLGAVLYVALTGAPPFGGDTVMDVLQAIVKSEPASPSSRAKGIPRDVETICLKCLEKNPARRYASAEELALDIERYLAAKPIEARPIGRVERGVRWGRRHWVRLVGVATLSLIIALLALLFTSSDREWWRYEKYVRGVRDAQGLREAVRQLGAELDTKRNLKRLGEPLLNEWLREAERDADARVLAVGRKSGARAALDEVEAMERGWPELKDHVAELRARTRKEAAADIQREIDALVAKDRFDDAEALLGQVPWMDATKALARINARRRVFEQAAEEQLASLAKGVPPDDGRYLTSRAWLERMSEIDAATPGGGALVPCRFHALPRKFFGLLLWQYDFATPDALLDWQATISRDTVTATCGVRPENGAVVVQNAELVFAAPLEGDLRLSLTVSGGAAGYALSIGGYTLERSAEGTSVVTPSAFERIIVAKAPPVGDREDVALWVAQGALIVQISGGVVLRRALPRPPRAVRPSIAARPNALLRCTHVTLTGNLRAGWAVEEAERQRAFEAVRAKAPDPGRIVDLLDAAPLGRWRADESSAPRRLESGVLTADARGGLKLELHGSEAPCSRLTFKYRMDDGFYTEVRLRAGFHECQFRLPGDRPREWRDVEIIALDSMWSCRVDRHLEYWPAFSNGFERDEKMLRVVAKDALVAIKEMRLERLDAAATRGPWSMLLHEGQDHGRLAIPPTWVTGDRGRVSGEGELATTSLYGDFELELIFDAEVGTRLVFEAGGRTLPPTDPLPRSGVPGLGVRVRKGVCEIENEWMYARHEVPIARAPVKLRTTGKPIRIISLRIRSLE